MSAKLRYVPNQESRASFAKDERMVGVMVVLQTLTNSPRS